MTEGQTKALLIQLWNDNKSCKETGDKLIEAGLMLSDAPPMNAVFASPANRICDILDCYGLSEDESFDKLMEAEKADDVNILLEVLDNAN